MSLAIVVAFPDVLREHWSEPYNPIQLAYEYIDGETIVGYEHLSYELLTDGFVNAFQLDRMLGSREADIILPPELHAAPAEPDLANWLRYVGPELGYEYALIAVEGL